MRRADTSSCAPPRPSYPASPPAPPASACHVEVGNVAADSTAFRVAVAKWGRPADAAADRPRLCVTADRGRRRGGDPMEGLRAPVLCNGTSPSACAGGIGAEMMSGPLLLPPPGPRVGDDGGTRVAVLSRWLASCDATMRTTSRDSDDDSGSRAAAVRSSAYGDDADVGGVPDGGSVVPSGMAGRAAPSPIHCLGMADHKRTAAASPVSFMLVHSSASTAAPSPLLPAPLVLRVRCSPRDGGGKRAAVSGGEDAAVGVVGNCGGGARCGSDVDGLGALSGRPPSAMCAAGRPACRHGPSANCTAGDRPPPPPLLLAGGAAASAPAAKSTLRGPPACAADARAGAEVAAEGDRGGRGSSGWRAGGALLTRAPKMVGARTAPPPVPPVLVLLALLLGSDASKRENPTPLLMYGAPPPPPPLPPPPPPV